MGAVKVRKKPCPYCGKKLQCKSKGRWRNNLARHFSNACPPYEKRIIEMGLRLFESVAEFALTGNVPSFHLPDFKSPDQIAKEQREVQELKKLYEK